MRCTFAVIVCLTFAAIAHGESTLVQFPSDHGFIDVKAGFSFKGVDYRATGDGKTDDTAALNTAVQLAMNSSQRVIYLPAGVYRVTAPVTLGSDRGKTRRIIFQGQGPGHTIVRLDNASPAYQDPKSPVAVVSFLDKPTGGHNQAFRNSVFDLEIDVGKDNPGAIALRYCNSNQGAVENVVLRAQPSADGVRRGRRGLDLTPPWPGPLMLRKLVVEGFDVGIDIDHYQYGIVGEDIRLSDQNVVAIHNQNNVVSMRRLYVSGDAPAYRDGGDHAMLVLLDSQIKGTGRPAAAFGVHGETLIRTTVVSGYQTVVDNHQKKVPDVNDSAALAGEYVNVGRHAAFEASAKHGLALPIEETPVAPYVPVERWVKVDGSADDDTAAVQKAIDQAGAPGGSGVIYFPHGRDYVINDTIEIRGNIRRICGMDAGLRPGPELARTQKPMYRIADLESPGVLIDRINGLFPGNHATHTFFHFDTNKTVTLRNLTLFGADGTTANTNGPRASGKVFIEDVTVTHWTFAARQQVWARQFNPESGVRTNVINDGATLWVLGLKTEYGQVNIETRNGGKTEVLGGVIYPAGVQPPASRPAFIIHDATASLTYKQVGSKRYAIEVRETRNGQTRETPQLGVWSVPLYLGIPN